MTCLLSVPLFLLSLDSLPPIPEPSELPVQEPPLWTELVSPRVLASGYAGGRFGGVLQYFSDRDSILASYQNENDWCLTRLAMLSARKTVTFGPCDITPKLDAMGAFMGIDYTTWSGLTEHRELYRLGYGISTALFTAPLVLEAGVHQRIWRIDSINHFENLCTLTAYFDRSQLLPQVVFNTLYQSGRWQPEGMLQMHLGSIHFGIGALMRFDSLSPKAYIAFRDVNNMVRVAFKQGLIPRPFETLVDPQVPIQYDFPGPAERVGWMVEVSAGRIFPVFTAFAGFRHRNDWDRCGLDYNNQLILFEGVRENTGFATASCLLSTGKIVFQDSCRAEYIQVRPSLPFVPRYRITNYIRIAYRSFSSGIKLSYFSERPGYHHTLLAVILLDGRIGYQFHSFTLSIAVYNILNRQLYMYDNYSTKPRTIAAGLEFSRP